ncbi:protein regulator of cytokinesis 1 [Trichonephila inaurata madagascariensis]|uniref:Protein regulator of cytokinesis 1 n=1 Tax=Trichonephila inaurata madagascariensis TaxID=2747483 RepID=A0A8X6YSF0_9ARAC|nr:protein regulator of cytokinesis 1 [Trichonephila inaurata madagascariensis]
MNNQPEIDEETVLEKIENEEIKYIKGSLQELYHIWQAFGIGIDQKSQRAKTVWVHIKNLLQDILKEEKSFHEEILESISNYKMKIQELCLLLSVTPKEINETSLIKEKDMLSEELDYLYRMKQKRIETYHNLKRVESEYCEILNIPGHRFFSKTGVPSLEDINKLKQHIDVLKDEKDRRHNKFIESKAELMAILKDTELTPETSFERQILSGKQNFLLSDETFKATEEMVIKVKKKKAELETEKSNLMQKLTTLWTVLQVDESIKLDFLSKHEDCSELTIKSIQQEIEKFQNIRKHNMEISINSLRKELQLLWNKCHVSESVQQCFVHYASPEITDEILVAHENETEKWRNYYNDVKHILTKIDQRQELWNLMMIFEIKTADPNRFKNRKGNLLQEERDRNKLRTNLPALENSIFEDIQTYESTKGCQFLYDGKDYRTFVSNQWLEKINQKENEKQERNKLHLLRLSSVRGTPGKRPPCKAPRSAPCKLLKSSDETFLFSPNSKMISNSAKKCVSRSSKLFSSHSKIIQKKDQKLISRGKNLQTDTKIKAFPNGKTYSDFAEELHSTTRWCLRSSVLATRKPGGTRILNSCKRKSSVKSSRKSIRSSTSDSQNFTPLKRKVDLPFLL